MEAIAAAHLRVYYIRSYNNNVKYSRQALPPNEKLIFTGGASKEIANFINSLVYRSFKKLSKALEGRRKSKKLPRPTSQEQNSFRSRKSQNSASGQSVSIPRNEYYQNSTKNPGSMTSIHGQPKILRLSSSSKDSKKSNAEPRFRY